MIYESPHNLTPTVHVTAYARLYRHWKKKIDYSSSSIFAMGY